MEGLKNMTKYHHEVKLVKIGEIRPNKYNPNVVPPDIMEQLVEQIKEEGFLQPVLLRNIKKENGYKYEIIDGEHRYNAALKAGYTSEDQLPSIILDKNLPEAMISTINMNKLRGEFDTLRLAEVIHTLHKTYSIEELEKKLGYTKDQQEGMTRLLDYDFDALDNEGVDLSEQEPEEYEFKTILTAKQNKVVQDALEATGKGDIPKSLVCICLEYLAQHGQKISQSK
jgi:ParB/RepB/Spo0J family partition protein